MTLDTPTLLLSANTGHAAAPFEPTPHAMLRLPTQEEIEAILAQEDGKETLRQWYAMREERIRQAEEDPLKCGFDLPHWLDADALLVENDMVYSGGGKRASKSEWACKRFLESALTYPGGDRWAFQDNEKTSQNTQQALIWRYLPPALKKLNEKESRNFKLKYKEGRGFTENFIVLPNGSKIHFLTYNQDPADFQGWEIGARVHQLKTVNGRVIQNIGAWADENMTPKWFGTVKVRLVTRSAKLIWTYSPLYGITPTIKEFRGAARTVKSKPSELLPNRKNVPDCPPGHMPYIQTPTTPNAAIIYFFTEANPFANYPGLRELLRDKPSDLIKQDAYGYAEEFGGRAFPLFGGWNIVEPEQLPEVGTNYHLTDPAGARNWATLWVRVTAGKEPSYYIYRDWPDIRRYGEWAKPSDDPNKLDGDPGPAQRTLGFGVIQYKQLFNEEERIVPVMVRGEILDRDPQRRRMIIRRLAREGIRAPYPADMNLTAPEWAIQEEILMRFIDPRAGRNQHVAEKGGTCLVDEFAKDHMDERTGAQLAAPMYFEPASGVDIAEGITQINALLYWDKEQPLTPITNAPRLYVSSNCQNVIWALSNWTGKDGEKGACKDFVDLVRWLALANLSHITPDMLKVHGGGSY